MALEALGHLRRWGTIILAALNLADSMKKNAKAINGKQSGGIYKIMSHCEILEAVINRCS